MTARATSETQTLTTTEAAVLALLALEGERSGYDLLKLVQGAIAYVWAPARSQLYAVLPRLVRDGLASRRQVAQKQRPDKHLYRISPSGRESLTAWLAAVEPGDRDALMLKVFVGGLAPDTVAAQLEQFRDEAAARLAEYRRIEPTNSRRGHDFYHYLLLRLGIDRAELDVRWAEWALEQAAGR